jgi:hypothetical protein
VTFYLDEQHFSNDSNWMVEPSPAIFNDICGKSTHFELQSGRFEVDLSSIVYIVDFKDPTIELDVNKVLFDELASFMKFTPYF